MRTNVGRQPEGTAGKRVMVELANGMRPALSWPAGGREGCRWTLTGHPFDIAKWELAK